ncbi:aspartic peptidase domain-containing protein, partial [Protomyces lactucae-debilis]
DSSWLTEVQIGTPPATLMLNFDSGSSDTWVMSTDLPVQERQGQVLYNPASSKTALAAPSNTWNISYADKSGASGFVGTDTLYLGGMPIRNQAIQRATYVSKDFFSSRMASGLLGLGFSSLNTVKPNPVRTPMENLIRQGTVQNPIFTVALKDSNSNATGQGGHFTFGYIDKSTYKGEIGYAPVNTSQGFWEVNCPYFKIGRNGNPLPRSQPNHPAIIDTGTTLMLLDDMTLLTIYNSIPGAKFDSTIGGYTIPCNAQVPDTFWLLGDQFYGVPGSTMAFAKLDGGRCYGAMQSRGDFPTDIMGDAFIKNQMVVFDQNPTAPRLGFAYR